jgi:transketolase
MKTGAVVTVEEHSRFGGLFSAVSETLAESQPVPIEYIAIEDRFGESGNYEEILQSCGLTADQIVKKVQLAVRRKSS